MPQLNLALILCLLLGFWLIWRRLTAYPAILKFIIISCISTIFFRPIIGDGLIPGAELFFQAVILSSAFSMLTYLCRRTPSEIVIVAIDKIMLSLIFFIFLSTFFSIYKLASIRQFSYFLSLYLFYWTIINLPNDKLIRDLLLGALISCCFILIIYAAYQHNIGFTQMREFLKANPDYLVNSEEFIKRANQNTVFATFIYPPAFAGYLCMPFLVLFGFCFNAKLKPDTSSLMDFKQFASVLMCLAIVPVLILTKSKGAWVAALTGVLIFFIFSKKSRVMFLSIGVTVLLFVFSFISIELFLKLELPKVANIFASLSVRVEYWKAAFSMIKSRPVFGFGPGTFGIAYPLFKTVLAEETTMAHNSFLQLWAESGIFCFLSFLVLSLHFLKMGHKRNFLNTPIALGIYCAFVSFLIHNIVDFGLFDAQRATIAFGLLGILVLNFPEKNKLLISSRKARSGLLVIFVCALSCVLIYSSLIYLGRRFDLKAGEALKKKQFNQAIKFSDLAIKVNPFSSGHYFHQAIILEQVVLKSALAQVAKSGYLGQALSDYRQAIKLNPFVALYHFRFANLLSVYKEAKYTSQVRTHLEKAAHLYPVNPFYHEQLSAFYAIIGEQAKAEQESALAFELKKYFKKGTK